MPQEEQFLSVEEQQEVIACVKRAEKRTSGEIVPLVASFSGSYQLSAVLASLFVVVPLALFAVELLRLYDLQLRAGLYLFLLLTSIACSALYYIMVKERRLAGLFRHFLLKKDVEQQVEEAALAAFYREGLYRTAAHNGVLLYISVFEQKVWILPDSGVKEKIAPHEWKRVVDAAAKEIAAGRRGAAICQAVDAVASLLQPHFPYREGDKDELDNLIIDK